MGNDWFSIFCSSWDWEMEVAQTIGNGGEESEGTSLCYGVASEVRQEGTMDMVVKD